MLSIVHCWICERGHTHIFTSERFRLAVVDFWSDRLEMAFRFDMGGIVSAVDPMTGEWVSYDGDGAERRTGFFCAMPTVGEQLGKMQ